MRELVQDLQYAGRIFRRSPGFTLGAVFTLALGFGVNTVVFSILYGVLLKPLPYPEPDRLAMIWDRTQESGAQETLVTPAEFLAWKQAGTVFAGVTAYSETERSVVLLGKGDPRYLKGSPVFANFFSVLGAQPLLGRVFRPEESMSGTAPVAVLSYRLWRELGSNLSIIGQTINLDQLPHEVIGVLPERFDYPIPGSDVWLPIKWNLRKPPAYFRTAHNLRVIGRVKPGISLEQAQAALNILAAAEPKSPTDTNSVAKVGLTPLRDWIAGDRKLPLLLLLGAAGLVLLIACVNVANLQLARAMARASEIVLRSSLGATSSRIVRQLVTESLLLSTLGAGAGFLLGLWALQAVVALAPGDLPRTNEIGPNPAVCLFVLAAALLSSLVSGLAPALQGVKLDYQALQQRGVLGATGPRQSRTRNLLLVTEVALAAMLMISAGLLLKSFYRLNQIDPGFRSEHVLTSTITLPLGRYRERERVIAFERQLLEHMKSMPDNQSVALVDCLPLQSSCWTGSSTLEGASSAADLEFHHRVVSPDYFKVLGVPLRGGRFFTETDDARATKVALVNETLAKLYFRDQTPLGRRIRFQREGFQDSGWLTIVGIVGDEKTESLTVPPPPEVFEPYLQDPHGEMNLIARTLAMPLAFGRGLREEVRKIDSSLPQRDIRGMEDLVSQTLGRQRFTLSLTALFAGLALLLTISGIYALVSYMVIQRTHEVGIRISLGAGKRQILETLVGRTMLMVLIGIGLGVCGALAASRILQQLLYQIDATDAFTYSVVVLSLGLVAFLSTLLPARKATRIDPMICLRLE